MMGDVSVEKQVDCVCGISWMNIFKKYSSFVEKKLYM